MVHRRMPRSRALRLSPCSLVLACAAISCPCVEASGQVALAPRTPVTSTTAAPPMPRDVARVVTSAWAQTHITRHYDPAYTAIPYPNGDVPNERGVCTDVVIRALRAAGLDLQRLVHEDMKATYDAYPNEWGQRRPDRNIDHRRVPNLETFFTRSGNALALTTSPGDFAPGDIVSWRLPSGRPHIGVVVDRVAASGRPLVVHNIGAGAEAEDVLFAWTMTGHFRVVR